MPLVTNSGWTLAEPLPAEYRDRLPAALLAAEQATAPAPAEAAAVVLADLVEWIETYGIVALPSNRAEKRERLAQIVARYRHDLADIPADLLRDAVRQITASAAWRALPLPGDIRKVIADELERRRHAVRRLTVASRMARFEDRPVGRQQPTARDLDAVSGMVEAVTQAIAADPVAVPEWRQGNPAEPPPKSRQEAYREAARAVQAAPRRLIPRPWVEGQQTDAAEARQAGGGQ